MGCECGDHAAIPIKKDLDPAIKSRDDGKEYNRKAGVCPPSPLISSFLVYISYTAFMINQESYALHLTRAIPNFKSHRFLFDDVAFDLVDRLQDIKRRFETVLNLSPHEIDNLKAHHHAPPYSAPLPFGDEQFDLIISCGALHWVDNLPALLRDIRRILKPDDLFLATFYGGDTLNELRTSLLQAEIELTGGASLRTLPLVRVQDAPQLLGMAGLKEPVCDFDTVAITYPDLKTLMADLKGMGENMACTDQAKSPPPRRLFERAESIYRELFGDSEGRLPATVQTITFTGWK